MNHLPPHHFWHQQHRPSPLSESPPHFSFPPPSHQRSSHPPQLPCLPCAPAHENYGHYPENPYTWQGSVSAPPAEPPRNHHYAPPPSAPHESPSDQLAPPKYHPSLLAPYRPPGPQPNGKDPPQLHIPTGHDAIPDQPQSYPPPQDHSHGERPPDSGYPLLIPSDWKGPCNNTSRQRRATQACDACRKRRGKCDESRPKCQHCNENDLNCVYRNPGSPSSDECIRKIDETLPQLTSRIKEFQKLLRDQRQVLAELQSDNRTKAQPRSDDSSGEELDYSMPPKHTTAVHHLFEWPLIKRLLPAKLRLTYVQDLEQKHSLFCLCDCFEGEINGVDHEDALRHTDIRSFESHRSGNASSTSDIFWDTGLLPQRPTSNEHSHRCYPRGLSPSIDLTLDFAAVDDYFRSYMDNMHILHPFMETKALQRIFDTFKRHYCVDERSNHKATSIFNRQKCENKDSPITLDDLSALSTAGTRSSPLNRAVAATNITNSITNAIVLLVMALGKVVAHRRPLPGPGHVPGFSYFATAAGILGRLPGGMDISHLQANLLAGLYMGQLARVILSHHYIVIACRICLVLIESSRYRNRLMSEDERNLIKLAFWSCLQLESDILAEIELPPSGITRYESRQREELPTNITIDKNPEFNPDVVLGFYLHQIQLRRTMNDVHTSLYDKYKCQRPIYSSLGSLNKSLQGWKSMLGVWNWDEDNYQSEDINVARMRAKYYGARYIINRPALNDCLSITAPQRTNIRYSDSLWPSGHSYEVEIDEGILHLAKTCVDAAIRSTTVFDKVPQPLIITNIFGTAHAQFGNVLVLTATYTSPNSRLSSLVPKATLQHLFERTINLLLANSAVSPVLKQDAEILEHVRWQVFTSFYP